MNPVEILLVEDNPDDADLIMRALRKDGLTHHLHWVKDGAEALDYIFKQNAGQNSVLSPLPRVIFLDLKLPKINGIEVVQILKKDPRTRSIPVVIVTSSAEDSDTRAAYNAGANGYVVKPVEFETFMSTMSTLGRYWLTINHFPTVALA